MGRVRNKVIKRSARAIIEKHYFKLCNDFQSNKRVCDDVAVFYSKKIRNAVAGYATYLLKRIQKGPVRGVSIKLQEEERERRDNYVPQHSYLKRDVIEVERPEVVEMVESLGFRDHKWLRLPKSESK